MKANNELVRILVNAGVDASNCRNVVAAVLSDFIKSGEWNKELESGMAERRKRCRQVIMLQDFDPKDEKDMEKLARSTYKTLQSAGIVAMSIVDILTKYSSETEMGTVASYLEMVYELFTDKENLNRVPTKMEWMKACRVGAAFIVHMDGSYFQMDVSDSGNGNLIEWCELPLSVQYTLISLMVIVAMRRDASEVKKPVASTKPKQRAPTKKQSEVISDLRRQVKSLQSQVSSVEAETRQPLQKQIDRQAQEIAQLKQRLSIYEQEEEIDKVLEEEPELLDLPETGVVFIGGHHRLVQKLMERFPGWLYCTSDQKQPNYGSPSIAFIHTGYIGHSCSKRAINTLPAERTFCVYRNNVDNLIQVMRLHYTKLQNRGI